MNIGEKIRKARADAGLTQEQVAETLNVSRQTISNWENEKTYPDIASVVLLSDAYGVSLDSLLKGEKPGYIEYLEESTNTMIQFGGVQVRPGDGVLADRSGVVFIPAEHLEEVVAKAESLYEKEEAMIADLRAGMSSLEVDQKYNYEKMLQK